ncbi:succinate dehydrogenase, hydrophobic membrane anchor protein [Rickettsia prowazekii]|uniref:Succinate dehydrogenase hydrophobic membrane anchor subunit n=2 Tax=Rickettsia prowazekii TaxID=782 RepID=DHSD_RICPR|nr:succinate dehydrogenase, hydrophobic membrane anchor protein [Rickettsia prowazekii]P41086.1 RecName: Full=Succinate dehydrogenase hydrophobic membrane anchor subunit [Rickettsia prowazekii str. Madrid E]EOB10017.1 Succinate dehydrogenase hydrophobic membrane anchor subunit [Rickettsia prowazekii str. GvF12]AAA18326.1 putative hydrophobic subunit of succinate dehydrogenase [Rickettsia prowazekii str. Madrid E]ADE29635.1 Succinate dehydrogenase hydrophobic membrane anchor protein [Rickettsia 
MIYDFKAEIIKAKNSSFSKSGSHHWLLQRVTGVILALCSFWLIYFMFTNKNNDINIIMWEFKKPFNIVILLITVTISLYHSVLGMRVVIEDYINCHKLRNTLIIIVKLFCILTIVSFVVAIFYSG